MYTLGIETSCDETSSAVLKDKDELLSNVIASSLFQHKPFGGVVPEIASRHCLEQIDGVLEEALNEAKVRLEDLDLIAVTYGPGLIGSLIVGISFAKALSYQLGIPLVGVNHLEAHLVANFIGFEEPEKYVGLLVSGGHTILSYHEKASVGAIHGENSAASLHESPLLLGETVDDAVGEAFDKVARLLGLGFPGGPIIEKMAREGNPEAYKFTKPKQDRRFDFSFSGVKTAVRRLVERSSNIGDCFVRLLADKSACPPLAGLRPSRNDVPKGTAKNAVIASLPAKGGRAKQSQTVLSEKIIRDIAASFQHAVIRWLVEKTLDAAEVKEVRHIVVGGGVAANGVLRERLTHEAKRQGIEVSFPARTLTLDNAGMVARRGWELYQRGERASLTLSGIPNLSMRKYVPNHTLRH